MNQEAKHCVVNANGFKNTSNFLSTQDAICFKNIKTQT